MSWYMPRVYTCDICGKTQAGLLDKRVWTLPIGWDGSDKKHGQCICSDCRDAIRFFNRRSECDGNE